MGRIDLPRAIIDAHCHVASVEFTPRAFIEGVVDNVYSALSGQGISPPRKRLLDLYLSKMRDPDCDELVAEMDEAGIGKSILLLPDLTYALGEPGLSIAEMFDRHHAILQRHPGRLFVFAGADPRWGADALALFERGVTEFGFRGLKLYPPCGYSPSDPSLYPFYEICAKYGLPVLSHTGATSPALEFEPGRPVLIDRAARDFPNVNFILAHGSLSYLEECVMMCAFRPNVYLDVSAYESAPLERLASIFLRGVNHKVIFGTDWPIFRLQARQKEHVDTLLGEAGPLAGLRLQEMELFFYKTIERLLNIH